MRLGYTAIAAIPLFGNICAGSAPTDTTSILSPEWYTALAAALENPLPNQLTVNTAVPPPDASAAAQLAPDGIQSHAATNKSVKQFSWTTFGTTLTGWGYTNDGDAITNMIANCASDKFGTGAQCAKHAVEVASAMAAASIADASSDGKTAVVIAQGMTQLINLLHGTQDLGGAPVEMDPNPVKRTIVHHCDQDLRNISGQLDCNWGGTTYGLHATCESSCQAADISSHVSGVLGSMADFVINNELDEIEFVASNEQRKAMFRCNIRYLVTKANTCPATIHNCGCDV